jgi:hypothetical protein
LVIEGELRVNQFWPKGGSDADTAVVEVLLAAKKPFTFVDNNGGRHPTQVFFDSSVIGRQGPMPVVKWDKKLDADKVNFPKFFRRQADHHVRRAVGTPNTPASFVAYVGSKPDDIAQDVTTFLKHKSSTPPRQLKKGFSQLGTFIKNGKYPTGKEVVFWEADSRLVNSTTNKPVTSW